MSFETTARQILKALKYCVEEQNKLAFKSEFVPCEGVRAQTTSFNKAADQQKEFVDWLLAMEGRRMVEVKRLNHEACMVALGPEGKLFLLTQSSDENPPPVPQAVSTQASTDNPMAFISHGTLDREFVERLARDLRANGVNVWYSGWEIKPGDSIRAKIDDGVERCDFFVIVLSKHSIGRPWVQQELDAATIGKVNGKVKKIIPIKIDDCGDLPPMLGSLCWEDFSTGSYEFGMNRVLDSILERDVRPPLGEKPVGSISVRRAIQLLEAQIAEPIENVRHDDPKAYEWEHITHRILIEVFGPHHMNTSHFITTVSYAGLTENENQEQHVRWVGEKKHLLRTFVRELQMFDQPTPHPPVPAAPDSNRSRLQFGDTTFAPIGTSGGHEAFLISIMNVEKRYPFKCHGVRTTLSFTYEHSGETLKKTGWFCSIDAKTGRVCDVPADSITLDSAGQSRTWLVVYINRNVEPTGQFWYRPDLESSPLMADYLLSHDYHRLFFGTWKIKVSVTSDSEDDRIEGTISLQAEGAQ